jgi:acyl-CoA thioesterase-1
MNTGCYAAFLLLSLATGLAAQETKPAPKPKAKQPDPAFAAVTDDPKLPRVLLIGDSISIGYTTATRRLLAGKVNLHRIPENGGPTPNGTAKLAKWLGTAKWDVIHFNWGLHDIKFMPDGKRQVSPEDYEKQLSALVKQMQATGAKLIWCSTTPVPEGKVSPVRQPADVLAYNAIAKKVMTENKVAINDLHAHAQAGPLDKIQIPVNVHFTTAGSEHLARHVAASIEAALKK